MVLPSHHPWWDLSMIFYPADGFRKGYHLVNVYITIENHNRNRGFTVIYPSKMVIFHFAKLVITRGHPHFWTHIVSPYVANSATKSARRVTRWCPICSGTLGDSTRLSSATTRLMQRQGTASSAGCARDVPHFGWLIFIEGLETGPLLQQVLSDDRYDWWIFPSHGSLYFYQSRTLLGCAAF